MAHESFGQRLRFYRRKAGLTQEQLGIQVGGSASLISQYERGVVEPSYERVIKIAQIFSLSPTELVPDPRSRPYSPYEQNSYSNPFSSFVSGEDHYSPDTMIIREREAALIVRHLADLIRYLDREKTKERLQKEMTDSISDLYSESIPMALVSLLNSLIDLMVNDSPQAMTKRLETVRNILLSIEIKPTDVPRPNPLLRGRNP